MSGSDIKNYDYFVNIVNLQIKTYQFFFIITNLIFLIFSLSFAFQIKKYIYIINKIFCMEFFNKKKYII